MALLTVKVTPEPEAQLHKPASQQTWPPSRIIWLVSANVNQFMSFITCTSRSAT